MTTDTAPPPPSIEELEEQAREANRKLAEAKKREHDKRTIGEFRDGVKDREKTHTEYVDRIEAYDADTKARLFGFGAFDGAIDGALVWVLIGSIYAVEKQSNENYTTLKTADGPLGVKQSPSEVFNEFFRVRFEHALEQIRDMQSELQRRQEAVEEKRVPIAPPAPPAPAPAAPAAGPDFATVSDAVSADDDVDEDLPWEDEDLSQYITENQEGEQS